MSLYRALLLHPDSACPAVAAIQVGIFRPHIDALILHYVVVGDIEALSIPPPAESVRADELWQHSCFEAFAGGPTAYLEFNFAPSTQWAAYRFDGYRSGMRDARIDPPHIEISAAPGRFELRAEVALPREGRLGLSAVIEDRDGNKSYWALAHPPGAPDFHHETCFALDLPPAPAP